MKHSIFWLGTLALATISHAHSPVDFGGEQEPFVITASNAANNELLVYNTAGTLLRRMPTGGQGGVSGNAGGIAQDHERLAVVNFQSSDVSVFYKDREHDGLHFESVIPALANPVSVAFGHGHLYVLTTTHVESHRIERGRVSREADGSAALLIGDGSAAQVGTLPTQLIFSEKSNAIETVNLDRGGAIAGTSTLVSNIPANVNAPFGLATRGEDAYVTIAHANEISLVRDERVLTVTGSGTQQAPCWVTLDGPFLFSSNSPSQTVSRYAVYGQHIIQDAAVVAHFNGDTTDITYRAGWAAVVDGNGSESHVSVFRVDGDGNFTLKGIARIGSAATNGVALVGVDYRYDH
jgi:hypothetical protein